MVVLTQSDAITMGGDDLAQNPHSSVASSAAYDM